MKTSSEVWSFEHLVHLINQIDWTIETLYVFSILRYIFYLRRARLRNKIKPDKQSNQSLNVFDLLPRSNPAHASSLPIK